MTNWQKTVRNQRVPSARRADWTSSYGIRDGVRSVPEFMLPLAGIAPSGKLWFRGESKEQQQPCQPSFARNRNTATFYSEFPDGGPATYFTKEEDDIVVSFQSRHPDDRFFVALNSGGSVDDPSWLAYAQHHGEKTRLLDVTGDPLTALYFAVEGHLDEDGYVYVYTGIWDPFSPLQPRPPQTYRSIFDIWIAAEGKLQYPPPVYTPLLYQPMSPTLRSIAQSGAFLWMANPLADLESGTLVIRVSADAKENIKKELIGFGKTKGVLFP